MRFTLPYRDVRRTMAVKRTEGYAWGVAGGKRAGIAAFRRRTPLIKPKGGRVLSFSSQTTMYPMCGTWLDSLPETLLQCVHSRENLRHFVSFAKLWPTGRDGDGRDLPNEIFRSNSREGTESALLLLLLFILYQFYLSLSVAFLFLVLFHLLSCPPRWHLIELPLANVFRPICSNGVSV